MRLGFHAPETEEELQHLVAEAAETRTPLEVMGTGTKRELGHPIGAGAVVSTEAMTGVTRSTPRWPRTTRNFHLSRSISVLCWATDRGTARLAA
jgi:FAD/FMN-containing dehydrogenase